MALRQSLRCLRLLQPMMGRITNQPALTNTTVLSQRQVYRIPSTMGLHTSQARYNASIVNIQDVAHFDTQVKQSTVPVVVDFHASWCGPCKLLGPRLESLIAAKEGKVILAKVDIDELSDLAIEHGVQAVPTVLAMKDGVVQDKFVGMKDDDHLTTFINKLTGE